ncbi:unnamed protein product [Lactuca virosa]|uniref:Uncharacterized protein n=1 Tax=Lactuca virosa TaxID=75947 RepID=A0AAU9MRJ8_9ASTR|nr:unnamed protein product [Lactuca virosa]
MFLFLDFATLVSLPISYHFLFTAFDYRLRFFLFVSRSFSLISNNLFPFLAWVVFPVCSLSAFSESISRVFAIAIGALIQALKDWKRKRCTAINNNW